jgi:hypothetical protein
MYHGVTQDDPKEKKERVLHTRIPAVLEAELKATAEALKVPVSNLVRTILEDAVAAADRATGQVEKGLKQAARSVHKERERLRKKAPQSSDPLADVVGFQPILVAVEDACTSCGKRLEPGENAHLGVTHGSAKKIFICDSCVSKRTKKKSRRKK